VKTDKLILRNSGRGSVPLDFRKYNQAVVSEIGVGLFILENNLVLFANEAFYSMHGFGPRSSSTRNFLDFVAKEFHTELMETLYAARDRVSPQIQMEYLRLHKDGRRIPTELRANTTSLDHGQTLVCLILDLNRAEEIRRATEAAQRVQ
jgi:PAS domain S-box-containing protein